MSQAIPTSVPSPLTTSTKTKALLKKQLIVLGLVVLARCVMLYAIPDEVESVAKVDKLTLPNAMAGWQGKDVKIDEFTYDFLKPEAIVQKRYTLGPPVAKAEKTATTQPQIEVLAMYTRDTEGFHPPDVCMIAGGWLITEHTQREVEYGGRKLTLEVITGEQRGYKKVLAYCFSDPSGAVSGRTVSFANMVLARMVRRRVGTVEVQFAYDGRSLLPNGDYRPELKKLMIESASSVYRQLGTPKPAKG